jgi:hypothetical protein
VSPDHQPPRFDGDERATLLGLLRFQRESMLRKLDGLGENDAARRLVGSETTPIWLVDHLARAESTWVISRFAGRRPPEITAPADVVAAAGSYRRTWALVEEIAGSADLAARCADPEYADTPLRWVLAHLLEETARHAGHADILRELIDGSTGR